MITVTYDDIIAIAEDTLDIPRIIDLGRSPNGMCYYEHLVEMLKKEGLTEDTLKELAEDGIRNYLYQNGNYLAGRIRERIARQQAELREEGLLIEE